MIVHYLNQFFAGLGGEEAAGRGPIRLDGPQGPGRALAASGVSVEVTLACGDDHFAEHEDAALATLVGWIAELRPDVVICGPAFGSGRYGYACGVLAREASRLGIPVVTGMHPDNPGVRASEGGAYIVPTGTNVAGMREAIPRVAELARRLLAGEDPGPPGPESYLPRAVRGNRFADASAADRAVDMLLAKLRGAPFRTEIAPDFDAVPVAPPVADLGEALVALVSEAGCVPLGNPDRLVSRRARMWHAYPLEGLASLAGGFETVHGGFDTGAGNADPNRLVPLDALRELEAEGAIGRLHPRLYTTTGVDTEVPAATSIGQEIAAELSNAGVRAVVLTGT